jgi:DNA-binding transcriptional ArsR family regulator
MKTSFYLPIFEALAHETRLKVFTFIYQSGMAGVRPKEMIDQFGFDSGTLDFHLKKLVAAKLIDLKIGCRKGTYFAHKNIPHELVRLFDTAHTDGDLIMFGSASIEESSRKPLH